MLIMIGAHALDAWTRVGDRRSLAYGYLNLLGGFAAPLFLWLAGVGLALSAEQLVNRTHKRSKAAEAIVRRGAEIFILAFLFRIQAFLISPGSPPITLFRVDILNVMGPAIALSGLLWSLSPSRRTALVACALAATIVAMATPLVRVAGWVQTLPTWLQWYVRPSGDYTTFTLFPWAGFVFAGAACGTLIVSFRGPRSERRGMAALAVAGALVLALGFLTASRPSIYAASSFWTSSPTYFAIRVGLMMLVLTVLYLALPVSAWLAAPFNFLEKFGRNSLFIYWIHVELVYGYATWTIHRRLPLWGTAVAYVIFCGVMRAAIPLRDRAVELWRAHRSQKSASGGPATARA